MTYPEADIEELIEELYDLRKEQYDKNEEIEEIKSKMFTLKEENEELNEENEELNEENEELKKVNLTLKQSKKSEKEKSMKSRNEIITLKKDIEALKKSLKDIEDNETKFKEQFKEDLKEDNKAVAIINYLDNQFKRVQKNNNYLKLLLSNEKKCKKFYIDFTKSLLLNSVEEWFENHDNTNDIRENGFYYSNFEINNSFIDLDCIDYQKRLTLLVKDVNEKVRINYEGHFEFSYSKDNEFTMTMKN